MRGKWIATIMLTGAFIGSAAAAQMPGGTNGDSFLSAVRESDGNKAISLIQGNGSTVVNYRGAKGETALNIATRRRDMTWVGYIIGAGADPNAGDDRGETPLIIAARLGWSEGASTLLKTGARVDLANKLGETPLIVAVQQRQPALVKLFLEEGANPDKADRAAGYSARDYAKRDGRAGDLTRLIETIKPSRKIISGPVFK